MPRKKSSKSTGQSRDMSQGLLDGLSDEDILDVASEVKDLPQALLDALWEVQQLPDLTICSGPSRQHGVLLLVAQGLLREAVFSDDRLGKVRDRVVDPAFDIGKRAANLQPDAMRKIEWTALVTYILTTLLEGD